MKKQVIAVDIDDVLAVNVPAFVEFSNQKWGTNLTVEDFNEGWAKMWGVDHEVVAERSKEWQKARLVRTYKHFNEAHLVLEKLAKKYELVITTSRPTVMTDDTSEWIAKYFPGIFSAIHFSGIWDNLDKGAHLLTKGELLKEIGASYLIDDQPKHCVAADEVGIKSLLFGDYPWNKDTKLSKNIVRVKDWRAIEEYFNDKS
jgi:5'(3')-deoxyribonucleotidase